MICYKDMAFCSDRKCINRECFRHHSHTEHNIDFLPVCWGDFSINCKDRIDVKQLDKVRYKKYESGS